MGSKKKKQESESSSSSSESESASSESSPEKKSKKTKRRSDSEPPRKQIKKSKKEEVPEPCFEAEPEKRRNEPPREDRNRRRKRSPSPEHRRSRDERRIREERGRFDERRARNNEHRYEDRYRDRRQDYQRRGRRDDNRGRDRNRRRSGSFDHANAKWGRDNGDKKEEKKTEEKQKPNFGLSGKLTEERNTFKGVVIKYSEPPEACKPKRRWRLYPFKGEKALQTLYIHRESAYLIGRERKVVDLPVDHPSCSKQHAVLQYRLVPFTRDDGTTGKRVRPYLIDLNSANGTFINNKKVEPSKYIELLEKDVIKFGFSSREYVLLHENSKDETQDDDVKEEEKKEVKEEKVKEETQEN